MVTSTKDMWLLGLTIFGQWETSNRFGGMKVVLAEQIGTVERQIWESIHMNLAESITLQLATKLIYQVFTGDLDEVHSFMQINHGTCNHVTLASRATWAIFKANK
eukprot:15326783-Ditylum_brightwellii.AAC.1